MSWDKSLALSEPPLPWESGLGSLRAEGLWDSRSGAGVSCV